MRKRTNAYRHQKYHSMKRYSKEHVYIVIKGSTEYLYKIKYRCCDSLLKVTCIIKVPNGNIRLERYTINKSDERWDQFIEFFRKGNELNNY